MELDDGFSLGELALELLGLAPQFPILGDQAPVAGAPASPSAPVTGRLLLASPVGQVRGVESLAPQQGADLSGLGAGVSFLDDALFILFAEASANGLGQHLRIRRRGSVCGRVPVGCGRGCWVRAWLSS